MLGSKRVSGYKTKGILLLCTKELIKPTGNCEKMTQKSLWSPHSAFIFSYLGAHTGLAFSVLFMGHPLVQLAPQRFGFPGGDFGLQTAVEGAAVGRVQVQLPAEEAEGLEGALTRGGLDEVLEQLPHVVPLLLHLAHLLPGQQMLWVRRGSLSARCG